MIPRNLAVTVAILCSLTLGMSLYLWQLRHREAANGPTMVVPQHVAAPASEQHEKVTMVIARDDTSTLHSQYISIPAFTNPQQRAEEILATVAMTDRQKMPVASLPHGDQRKLEVALLMALESQVCMFDEPTSGMSADEAPVKPNCEPSSKPTQTTQTRFGV